MIWPLRRIGEAGLLPRGYGLAWYSPTHRAAVCAPVPLNVVLAWLRRVYADVAAKASPDLLERTYDRGYTDGRDAEQRYWERVIEHLHRDHVTILTREMAAAEARGRKAVIDHLCADLERTALLTH
jgi:hypothetical protein